MATLIQGNFPEGEKQKCEFKFGDRVRHKEIPNGADPKYWTGTVARLPQGPVIQLGPHTLGNEMSVECDGGSLAVEDVNKWELVDD